MPNATITPAMLDEDVRWLRDGAQASRDTARLSSQIGQPEQEAHWTAVAEREERVAAIVERADDIVTLARALRVLLSGQVYRRGDHDWRVKTADGGELHCQYADTAIAHVTLDSRDPLRNVIDRVLTAVPQP